MKKLIMLGAMIAVFGLGTAAALAGTSDRPPSPPGQPDCEHGNSQKPCKDDPQPEHGNECDEHGNLGGQNEDHCKNETTPTDTTPTPTTPTATTPADTTPTDTTSGETSSTETTATATTATETPSSPQAEPHVFTPPASQQPAQSQPVSKELAQSQAASVAGAVARPSKAPQLAPFTP